MSFHFQITITIFVKIKLPCRIVGSFIKAISFCPQWYNNSLSKQSVNFISIVTVQHRICNSTCVIRYFYWWVLHCFCRIYNIPRHSCIRNWSPLQISSLCFIIVHTFVRWCSDFNNLRQIWYQYNITFVVNLFLMKKRNHDILPQICQVYVHRLNFSLD